MFKIPFVLVVIAGSVGAFKQLAMVAVFSQGKNVSFSF